MSKKTDEEAINKMGLQHRHKYRPVERVPVHMTGKRTVERAFYDTSESWKEKNCTPDQRRALDEIEEAWRLEANGGPTAKQFPYHEIGSRATNTDPRDIKDYQIELLQFVRRFEFKMKRMYPDSIQSFYLRFRSGLTFHKVDKGQRKGLAAQHCLLILKLYVKERGWDKKYESRSKLDIWQSEENQGEWKPDYKSKTVGVDNRGRIEA